MGDETNQFSDYVERSEVLAFGASCVKNRTIASEPLLNGVPYRHFRDSIDIAVRREKGAFFTGLFAAKNIAHQLKSSLVEDASVMDPTCGIGDLLLAYAALLPLKKKLASDTNLLG